MNLEQLDELVESVPERKLYRVPFRLHFEGDPDGLETTGELAVSAASPEQAFEIAGARLKAMRDAMLADLAALAEEWGKP